MKIPLKSKTPIYLLSFGIKALKCFTFEYCELHKQVALCCICRVK